MRTHLAYAEDAGSANAGLECNSGAGSEESNSKACSADVHPLPKLRKVTSSTMTRGLISSKSILSTPHRPSARVLLSSAVQVEIGVPAVHLLKRTGALDNALANVLTYPLNLLQQRTRSPRLACALLCTPSSAATAGEVVHMPAEQPKERHTQLKHAHVKVTRVHRGSCRLPRRPRCARRRKTAR